MAMTGYSDQWSVEAGQEIRFMLSADGDRIETQLVRLLHGDDHPDGPGFQEEELESEANGSVAARVQTAVAGSYVFLRDDRIGTVDAAQLSLSVWPTLRSEAPQTIASMLGSSGDAWQLQLLGGRLRLLCTRSGETDALEGPELVLRQWATIDALALPAEGLLALNVTSGRGAGNRTTFADQASIRSGPIELGGTFILGARAVGEGGQRPDVAEHFNGKVDSPVLRLGVDAARDRSSERWHSGVAAPKDATLAWDLAKEPHGAHAVDVTGNGRHGTVVNAPARLMTGPGWDGKKSDPAGAPEQWSAIHLHEDDLEDAGWSPTVSWEVPKDIPSAVYALRVRCNGEEDHLPFVVRPRAGGPRAEVALLLPTFTYMAYANERLLYAEIIDDLVADGAGELEADRADKLLSAHPEFGLSIYDRHSDGSGCCYSSRLRPIPNFRPKYRFWSTGGPERFGADLYLVHHFEHHGRPVDVFTDEDLHHKGHACLEPYKVLVTGAHPEYYTVEMLEALDQYLGNGGKLMYLGGNGFYWVTSVDRERPHLIEVRRGHTGTRAWTSEPGEVHHSTTGEQGGLWRLRGRDPNRLVGVGFSAQADSPSPAAGYRRLPASNDPRAAFVFDGIGEEEIIGDFGLINDGAAGYEIDRVDTGLGAPADVLRLATSEGMHGSTYLQVVEDIEFTHLDVSGPTSDDVRADMTLLPYPNGGAVFSVGSCNWCASLSHANYENNVARITENVINGFLAD